MRGLRVLSRGPLTIYSTPVRQTRFLVCSPICRQYQSPDPNPSPSVGPDQPPGQEDSASNKDSQNGWKNTAFKMFESAATTFASLAVLGAAGYGYHLYYKALVLRKMTIAFEPGDPVLDLSAPTPSAKPLDDPEAEDQSSATWFEQDHQQLIDHIISGQKKGRYYLVIGEKGTGKSSMIIEAMRKVDADGVSMLEAHADLEIFRIRLGKALNYEFHEDYIGSLFSVRGPRDTTALLDIERAFNKLEKIAMQRRQKKKSPMVIVINSAHLIRDDDDGKDLLELIQQRAEQWAASNLVTFVLNSDDYWVYERLKSYATRMEVVTVRDLTKPKAMAALRLYRARYFPQEPVDEMKYSKIYEMVGGRINYLSRVAKAHDMEAMAGRILENEKTWFLNRCGILGEEMDDDVMDQQKFASCAMVLARALVEEAEKMDTVYDADVGHILPSFPLYKARQIMTRADFVQLYDHDNIFTIDSNAMVRADSVPMMNAFKQICAEPGFDAYLEATLDRISAIESLNRTRELTFKDLWIEQSGTMRGAYEMVNRDFKGREIGRSEFRVKPDPEPEEDEEAEKDEEKKG